MNDALVTRRQALLALAALGGLPIVGCSAESDPADLVALRRDPRSAALLGRVWLAGQRAEPSTTALMALICGASGCAAVAHDPDGMRRLIAERHGSDFQRGKLVSVDGWLLSETEVALYALVAMADRAR